MIRIGILGHPKSKKGTFTGEWNPSPEAKARGITFTPLQLWDQFIEGAPEFAEGIVLDKWVCEHSGKRFRDHAPVDGPALTHGDAVTFYVKKTN